jgi:hypothetical protein
VIGTKLHPSVVGMLPHFQFSIRSHLYKSVCSVEGLDVS